MKKLILFLSVWLCAGPSVSGLSLMAQIQEVQCEGTLGNIPAGMTIEVGESVINGGHYFIAGDLRDIPLTNGTVQAGNVSIRAADGSSFELRFKSNGSEHGEPLSFENSVGLTGTWRNGQRVEKVDFGFETMGKASHGRRYEAVTDLSDSEFEEIIREWRKAVLAGNRKEAAKYTHFPLRTSDRRFRVIRTPAQLYRQWSQIFTPAYLPLIKNDLPHDMFAVSSSSRAGAGLSGDGGAMLGRGDVWFGDKGVEVLNLPEQRHRHK